MDVSAGSACTGMPQTQQSGKTRTKLVAPPPGWVPANRGPQCTQCTSQPHERWMKQQGRAYTDTSLTYKSIQQSHRAALSGDRPAELPGLGCSSSQPAQQIGGGGCHGQQAGLGALKHKVKHAEYHFLGAGGIGLHSRGWVSRAARGSAYTSACSMHSSAGGKHMPARCCSSLQAHSAAQHCPWAHQRIRQGLHEQPGAPAAVCQQQVCGRYL